MSNILRLPHAPKFYCNPISSLPSIPPTARVPQCKRSTQRRRHTQNGTSDKPHANLRTTVSNLKHAGKTPLVVYPLLPQSFFMRYPARNPIENDANSREDPTLRAAQTPVLTYRDLGSGIFLSTTLPAGTPEFQILVCAAALFTPRTVPRPPLYSIVLVRSFYKRAAIDASQ